MTDEIFSVNIIIFSDKYVDFDLVMGHLEIPDVHTASVHTCSFVQFEFPHLHSPAWHISPGAHATFLQGSLERVGWKNFEMFDIIGCIENYFLVHF